jgi:hypothetical protein
MVVEQTEPQTEPDPMTRLMELHRRVIDAAYALAVRKTELKEAKENHDLAVQRRDRFIGELDGKAYPLLDQVKAAAPPAPAPDAWRSTPIVALADHGLSETVVATLAEADILNLGDLSDFTAKLLLTDIEGIGPAKAEAIEDALEGYWAAHPVPADAPDREADFRALPVERLALGALTGLLTDAGITTLGQLADRVGDTPGHPRTWDDASDATFRQALAEFRRGWDESGRAGSGPDPGPDEADLAPPRGRKAKAAHAEIAAAVEEAERAKAGALTDGGTADPALNGSDVAAGFISCNQCFRVRPADVHPCPDDGCPEYSLSTADREPEPAPKGKPRKPKATSAEPDPPALSTFLARRNGKPVAAVMAPDLLAATYWAKVTLPGGAKVELDQDQTAARLGFKPPVVDKRGMVVGEAPAPALRGSEGKRVRQMKEAKAREVRA